jgi:nucleotide-binding universal stress UspA family protein
MCTRSNGVQQEIVFERTQVKVQITGVTLLKASLDEPVDSSARERRTDQRMLMPKSDIEKSVNDFEMACQAAKVKYRIVKESVHPFSQLVDLAHFHDLMVLGLRSIFLYDFLAGDIKSLLIQLINSGLRPMIAVSEEFRHISRVMIAYSGSIESVNAIKRFVQMRLWPSVALRMFSFHPSAEKTNDRMRSAEDYCRSHGFNVCHQSNFGDPKVLLLAAANLSQADMIVMGNSARNVLVRKVLGDTLVETLRQSKLPLFLAQRNPRFIALFTDSTG